MVLAVTIGSCALGLAACGGEGVGYSSNGAKTTAAVNTSAPTTAPATTVVPPTATTAAPTLTGFDVRSAMLPAGACGAGGGAPFALSAGSWTGAADGSPNQASIQLVTTVTGPFSGGAGDDVAALFSTQPGGTTSGGCIVVWEPSDAGPRVAAWTTGGAGWPGQLMADSGLQSDGSHLTTKAFSFAPDDPHCCPSITTPVTLAVSGDSLSIVSTGTPSASPSSTSTTQAPPANPMAGAVITTDGVGPVKLGMTVTDAATASGLTPKRSGCNGSYSLGPLLLGTGAGDVITTIATADPSIATKSGARVGMTAAQVQGIYGSQARSAKAQNEPILIVATDDGRSEVVFSIANGSVIDIVVATGTNGEYGESAGC